MTLKNEINIIMFNYNIYYFIYVLSGSVLINTLLRHPNIP